MKFLLALFASANLCFAAAHAQWQPSRTVQIILPNAPGGGPDFIVRLMAPKLSEVAKQSVVVENRASNNGIVGTEFAARGAPDGTMLILGNSGTHAINASLYRKLPYDPLRDFSAVSQIASPTLALVSHPAVPARNVKELIAIARQSPGKLNIAIAGATGEVAGNAMKLQAGVDMRNINFKGGGPSIISVISGETDLLFTNYLAIEKHVEAGKMRLLGITSAKRNPRIPNVPTIAEGGLPGYAVDMWYGLFVPSKTPASIVQGLHKETSRIAAEAEFREKLETSGHTVINNTPEQFAGIWKDEVEKFRRIIVDSKMPLN